jgi:hypothetical protein
MDMRIDERWDHGAAGKIDAHSAARNGKLAAPANGREAVAIQDEGGILDRRAAVAGDEPGAVEQDRLASEGRERAGSQQKAGCKQKSETGCRRSEVSKHGSLRFLISDL